MPSSAPACALSRHPPPTPHQSFRRCAVLQRRLQSSMISLIALILPLRFFCRRAQCLTAPFGSRSRVYPLSELSELAELDNPSPRCHWLPATDPSSRALALFGGGTALQLRPCHASPLPAARIPALSSGGCIVPHPPHAASALFGVARCFSAASSSANPPPQVRFL